MSNYLELLKDAKNNPGMLSELHLRIAYDFATTSEEYEKMIDEIVKVKRDLMIENKTTAKAEQLFELTDIGVKERKIKIRLKSWEKLLSAIKRRLETLSEESKNQY